jgi:hypothetical protein
MGSGVTAKGAMASLLVGSERYVNVNWDALELFAKNLAEGYLAAPDWLMPIYPSSDEAFVQFIAVENALNYCFGSPTGVGKFLVRYKGLAYGGAGGLCAALMRARDEGTDLLDALVLRQLTLRDVAHLFRSDGAELPLMTERAAMLNSLGADLARYGGKLRTLFEEEQYSAPGIVRALVHNFGAYGGDYNYDPVNKRILTFDKRARLLVVIYEGRARSAGSALTALSGLEEIGPIIDYKIPQVLRSSGILTYCADLARKVDAGELLPAGSYEELSLRAVTYDVVATLLDMVNSLRESTISMVELDYALWAAGRTAGGRHHLTLTTSY